MSGDATIQVLLSPDPLDPMDAIKFVSGDDSTGAISMFIGTTRKIEYPTTTTGCRKDILTMGGGGEKDIQMNCMTGVTPTDANNRNGEEAFGDSSGIGTTGSQIIISRFVTPRNPFIIYDVYSSLLFLYYANHSSISLLYEAYPDMAIKMMKDIASDASKEYQLNKCYVVHRMGLVQVAKPSIIIACASSHRKESHEATMKILNEIKSKVPIWKKVVPDVNSDKDNGFWSQKSEAFWLSKS